MSINPLTIVDLHVTINVRKDLFWLCNRRSIKISMKRPAPLFVFYPTDSSSSSEDEYEQPLQQYDAEVDQRRLDEARVRRDNLFGHYHIDPPYHPTIEEAIMDYVWSVAHQMYIPNCRAAAVALKSQIALYRTQRLNRANHALFSHDLQLHLDRLTDEEIPAHHVINPGFVIIPTVMPNV